MTVWVKAQGIVGKAVEVDRVASAYGADLIKLGFLNARLDTVPIGELMKPIEQAVDDIKPEIVYLLHGGDIHTDHSQLFTASMSVLKPFYMTRRGIRRVLAKSAGGVIVTDVRYDRWVPRP